MRILGVNFNTINLMLFDDAGGDGVKQVTFTRFTQSCV